MALDLYFVGGSAPCRAVMLTARALNLKLNLILVDLQKKEQLKEDFVKINPQHTVPTLVDEGFAISESRAIITYLVNKYAKGSALYPEDAKARALVDQRLYFDVGTLYARFADYFYPQLFANAPGDKDKLERLEDALKVLDIFLEGQKFVAGPNLTVADLSLVASISTIEASNIDISKYANVKRWYALVESTAPGYKDVTESDLAKFIAFVNNMKK